MLYMYAKVENGQITGIDVMGECDFAGFEFLYVYHIKRNDHDVMQKLSFLLCIRPYIHDIVAVAK